MNDRYMDVLILEGEYQIIKLPVNQSIPVTVLEQESN